MSEARPQRLAELDGLRGLAALSVVFNHCLALIPAVAVGGAVIWVKVAIVGQAAYLSFNQAQPLNSPAALILRTPLGAIADGGNAVLFFFLLSGFVLAIPFIHGRPAYLPFVIRRLFRLYPPYALAVLLALSAALVFGTHSANSISGWVTTRWTVPVTGTTAAQQLSLLLSFENNQYDPVLWSLVHEARVSLAFPLIAVLALGVPVRWLVPLLVVLWIPTWVLGETLWIKSHVDYGQSLEYVPIFALGVILARHHASLTRAAIRVGTLPLALAGLLLYTYSNWFFPSVAILHPQLIDIWFATAGAGMFILVALASKRLALFLRSRPVTWLGRVSYSLYLVHAVIILVAVHLLPASTPLPLIWLLVIPVAFGVAHAVHSMVERPSNRTGHRIADRVQLLRLRSGGQTQSPGD